ncbi:GLPGLI family protein [Chryseobacterium caseinilyticum]|uniref:GLPGLI family protein n=1 Tax=Chryseobacterium caseinilyticum TaxID=2771428 RepID=A0ABR8ZG49_9FLAO|nr:GLPGLI family protein [Chryseobacterium caseinilyticum]MBD8084192.1 GLPGLI family protein [Chryseobacterium caseinilyticum]
MKLYLNFVALLYITFVSAQNKEFTYEYRFISDSTNQKEVSREIMILNVGNEKSYYYSLDKLISDSTINEESKKNMMVMPLQYRIGEMVIKDLKNNTVSFETKVGDANFSIEQNINLKWNLVNEFDEILNYKVQKATTNFGGRIWNAWFAKDIPIQDGPYKFKGLPGLILKIEDKTLSHKFILKGIKNVQSPFEYPYRKDESNPKRLDYETYIKNYLQNRAEPTSHLIGRIPDQTDAQGNFRTGEQIIREIRKTMLEKISKDNNIIEIDVLKNNGKSKKR